MAAHEEKVAGNGFQLRQLPPVDPVGVHDDQALLGLAENLRQPHRRQLSAAEHVAEGKAGTHRGKLVRITHQNQPLSLGDGLEQGIEQFYIHHGHLVHDHRVRFQGVILVPDEEHFPGVLIDAGFQQPVDGGGVLPRYLRQPLGGPACGSGQQAAKLHLAQ